MSPNPKMSAMTVSQDLRSGLVVFLVAIPLCLGIALASDAPLISGVLAGIIGGVVVGSISRSQTSVSGPAAGLTAIVAAQIAALGSFEAFLLAVVIAGVLQVLLGIIRAGFIAAFFPSSVIKGLLAAIGVILILKQIPHLFGHDTDPEGEMSFRQPDQETTFTELQAMINDIDFGASLIGLTSIVILAIWDRVRFLKKSPIPAPLVVVLVGMGMNYLFREMGTGLSLTASHLVQVPVAETAAGFTRFLVMPDFSQWSNPLIYKAAITIALVASLETLLNLEAVDRIDPQQRHSPPSRELFAQGVGNITAGLIGGLPITSVIIRGSVNVNSGCQTRLSTIFHGLLLVTSVIFFPQILNLIPLSSLAGILLVTGFKLASPQLVSQMWKDGRTQFVPFIITVIAIVFTDLLIGILIGLAVSISFILYSNFRTPLRRMMEKHIDEDVLHVELPNQVSFFKRAAIQKTLDEVPRGGHVLIDAQNSVFIDPDVLDLIRTYSEETAPARGVEVSLKGFRERYNLTDRIQFVDYSTRESLERATPQQILEMLKEGHKRFFTGERLNRDLARQVGGTASSQHPSAVILSCIDSRAPAELIFDLGVGDIFSVRIAGNIAPDRVMGSIEYACAVVGSKLIVVMGHTRCGAVTTAVQMLGSEETIADSTGCQHIDSILADIHEALSPEEYRDLDRMSDKEKDELLSKAAIANVEQTIQNIMNRSQKLAQLVDEGQIAIVGALYDVSTGDLQFLHEQESLATANESGQKNRSKV
ncbi:bifunctional SulP family inorganic anion transporter/carbonic anhydrase [Rubinisphaera sp. JC750]|uniref:bifunctional SulP family inorganic anion transporter/carbonic anhydrase n=1 Tax=Rubinisphaera sp. JC750 TaxID=2898658 RepID=UPI001EFFEA55|nr:SulP family inorganic anion transporter [Rubinisphaera sp. JC750]